MRLWKRNSYFMGFVIKDQHTLYQHCFHTLTAVGQPHAHLPLFDVVFAFLHASVPLLRTASKATLS